MGRHEAADRESYWGEGQEYGANALTGSMASVLEGDGCHQGLEMGKGIHRQDDRRRPFMEFELREQRQENCVRGKQPLSAAIQSLRKSVEAIARPRTRLKSDIASDRSRVTRSAEPNAAPICESPPNQTLHLFASRRRTKRCTYLRVAAEPMHAPELPWGGIGSQCHWRQPGDAGWLSR